MALGVIKRAQVETSELLEVLGGTESPGRTWMLIFTAQVSAAMIGHVLLISDLEWKLVYVGSAEDEAYDQVLESVFVGPVNVGAFRFIFEADPVDTSKIQDEDIIGVTVLLLTCSYAGQEFLRIRYYVNNDYDDEQLREEPPQKVLIDRVQRNILADKPRVTKFQINFHPEIGDNGAEQAQGNLFEEQSPPTSEQSLRPSEQSLLPPEQTVDRT